MIFEQSILWETILISWYQSNNRLSSNPRWRLPYCRLISLPWSFSFSSSILLPLSIIMSTSILSDKPSSKINIMHALPLVLDLDQLKYDIWRELFEIHCINLKGYVKGYRKEQWDIWKRWYIIQHFDHHLHPPPQNITEQVDKEKDKATVKSAATKFTWTRTDSIFRSWMHGTFSNSLLRMIYKRQVGAYKVWESLEFFFHDNKSWKIIQLDSELCNITIGSSVVT